LRIFRQFLRSIFRVLPALAAALSSLLKSRASLELENRALRHQIGVLQPSAKKRPKLTAADRVLWAWLRGVWHDWRSALVIVKPDTVIAWQWSAPLAGKAAPRPPGLQQLSEPHRFLEEFFRSPAVAPAASPSFEAVG
jgi:hypothetical protein